MEDKIISYKTTALSPQKGWLFIFIPNEQLGTAKRVFLTGTCNGRPFQATANPWKDNTHVVTVNQSMRRELGISEGDEVMLTCTVSTSAPDLPLDEDIAMALDQQPRAREAFADLGRNKQKAHLNRIRQAKSAETRSTRISEMIEELLKNQT